MSRYNQPIDDAQTDQLLAIDGVSSVGMGVHQGREAVIVGVDRESVADQLPGQIQGYPVVAEVSDRPDFASIAPPSIGTGGAIPTNAAEGHGDRVRPVVPGISIGGTGGGTGTASFLATDGDTLYQLSNNHVLAGFDEGSEGDVIMQPGLADGGREGEDDVGELAGYVPVQGQDTRVDAAWYRPFGETEISGDILSVGEPLTQTRDPQIDDEITFSGRTSGVVTGTVDRTHMAIELSNGQRFTDQFRIDTPLIAGDSGSPIVMEGEDGPVPVGLGFAANDTHGFCNYISNVEADTGLTVLPAGVGGPALAGVNPIAALVVLGLGFAAYREYRDG